jgi:hypothetical protein
MPFLLYSLSEINKRKGIGLLSSKEANTMQFISFLIGIIIFIIAGTFHLPWLALIGLLITLLAIFTVHLPVTTKSQLFAINIDDIPDYDLEDWQPSHFSIFSPYRKYFTHSGKHRRSCPQLQKGKKRIRRQATIHASQ